MIAKRPDPDLEMFHMLSSELSTHRLLLDEYRETLRNKMLELKKIRDSLDEWGFPATFFFEGREVAYTLPERVDNAIYNLNDRISDLSQ